MRKLSLALVVLICVAVDGRGQTVTRDANVEREVAACEHEFVQALQGHDRAALERVLAESFTFIHASGHLDTRNEYINLAVAGRLVRQFAETDRLNEPWRIYAGHTALRQSVTVIAGQRLRNTTVYAKIDGRWLLVAMQSTPLPVRPQATSVDRGLYNSYVGQYRIDAVRMLDVFVKGGTLMGRVPLRPEFELIPKSNTEFTRYSEEGGYGDELVFVIDKNKLVISAILRDKGQEIWRASKVR